MNFKNWNVFESTAIQDLQTFEEDSKNKFSIPNAIVGNTIYKVTATSKDESGEIVSTQKMVEITSYNLTIIPTYESLSALKQTYSVGDSLNVNLYSSLQKIFLIKNIVNHNKIEGEKNKAGKHDVPSPIVMSGTRVLAGEGKMIVLVVGDQSCIGKVKSLLVESEPSPTPLQMKL